MVISRQSLDSRESSNAIGNSRCSSYLDSKQMADSLGICLRTLSNLRGRRVIPFIKFGRVIRYQRDAVESALSTLATGSKIQGGEVSRHKEYIGTMRRRSKDWPAVFDRKYPTGRIKYGVDLGKQGSKERDKRLFDTQQERDDFVREARAACEQQGQLPFFLPFDVQSEAVKLVSFLQPHNITLDDVRRHYEEDVIPYLKAPSVPEIGAKLLASIERKYTHRRRTSRPDKIKGFVTEFGQTFPGKITDIKYEDLEKFCFLGNSFHTDQDRRALSAQIFNFAIKRGWAEVNLADNLEMPLPPIHQPEYLSVDKVHALLAVANDFGLLGYFVLGFFAGIRPEELQSSKKPTVQWSDVHDEDGIVVVRAEVSKIGQQRDIPINETLKAWLSVCSRDGGPIAGSKNFTGRFRKCREAVELYENWCQDVVRHTFATNHAAAYKNLNETAHQMGHIGGLRILKKHYVAYVPEKAAKEFWALRPSIPNLVPSQIVTVPEPSPIAA